MLKSQAHDDDRFTAPRSAMRVGAKIVFAVALGVAASSPTAARAAGPDHLEAAGANDVMDRPSNATTEEGSTLPNAASSPGPSADQKPREVWYGWEPLVLDGVATASLILAVRASASELAFGSVALYAFGGPIVHMARGHVLRGFGDLAMRIALPVVGGLAGSAIGSSSSSPGNGGCGEGCAGLALGYLAGLSLAMALDASVLSFDEAKPPETARRSTWSPTVAVTPMGARLGVGGTF